LVVKAAVDSSEPDLQASVAAVKAVKLKRQPTLDDWLEDWDHGEASEAAMTIVEECCKVCAHLL
jgi:hypothetical protein